MDNINRAYYFGSLKSQKEKKTLVEKVLEGIMAPNISKFGKGNVFTE